MISCLVGLCLAFESNNTSLLALKDMNTKKAVYEHKVQKHELKENFERAKLDRHPSGYMTVEEYEILSAPKDRMEMEAEIPKEPTPHDMVYVPQPSYKLVKFNNPPGSPELTITNNFYKNWQQNSQGIVAPDFEKLVYPSVYYYPNSGSTACDLFVIKLDDAKTNLDKVLTANVMHRYQEPIMSTTKDNDNYYTFRTITPVDFSSDSRLILAKEKIGNTKDGIWKTTPIIYDFETKTSYNLQDVRSAIEYYWKETKNANLRDKRWDITPLGFSSENPDVVVVKAVGYTGDIPVNLGIWSISAHGENPKLLSLSDNAPEISMNGFKLVKSGVVAPEITKREEKAQKKIVKNKIKREKQEDRAELKEMTKSYKAKVKEMNAEFKESQKDYAMRQKINSTTSENEALEKYKELKEQKAIKRQLQLEKQKEKELKQLEKRRLKEEAANKTM